MPLCGKSEKKKSKGTSAKLTPVQRVVVPKGMINPSETTIIEIPAHLHTQPVVVAKRKISDQLRPDSQSSQSSSRGRRTAPRKEQSFRNFSPPSNSTAVSQREQYNYQPGHDYRCYSSNSADEDSNVDLEQTEEEERLQLQRDLEEFQKARRKLIESASKFATRDTMYDPRQSLMNTKNYR